MKSLTVSRLIRKFNIIQNVKQGEKFPIDCLCIFKLDNTPCPVHKEINELADKVLTNFIHKKIIYIDTMYIDKIIYNNRIRRLLPLVIHLHGTTDGRCHLFNKAISLKLNNTCIKFTNLLILNVIECRRRICCNYNKELHRSKTLDFKFAIFINCKSISLHDYTERLEVENRFKIHIGKLLTQIK